MSSLSIVKSRTGFYEHAVLNALARMTCGSLSLTLPSGERIQIGTEGAKNEAHIEIKDPMFFKRLVLYGDIGFGEAYVDGMWETDNITNVIKWVLLNIENAPSVSGSKAKGLALNLFKWLNRLYHNGRANSISGSQKNIAEHYDLNNDFFATFLDPSMTYSSGYFYRDDLSLLESQYAKYERLCRQLKLQSTDHVLEIGSGWGGNAIYMAKNYGCRVTSVTISVAQQKLAVARVEAAGLSALVDIVICDYRDLQGKYDKIVSIEMLEAVGHNYYETYFAKCDELLKQDGILAFQVITSPDSRYDHLRKGVDWIQKHIFPGSLLPSVAKINDAVNKTGDLTLVDLKDMGLDYARTLKLWFEQFNVNLNAVKALGFDERFIRKWQYYLNYCEAAFAMRNINVMQMVYVRPNNTAR
ncbi:cyclopropane-fatty-acyl-phospholipid synthase family protein [Pedobacter sp. MC2016-24]|uniref:SAM-dependent methyltransferase n=1 Tax=Pedobacter sp. MC2016-24 TaxID=2780090 RepID=UPI001881DBAA|nr:cyclopropane-fatty-acyl-phospholipid synthase family protein [Pedobacter sp. MC2016-24]MBE9602404.1 class I SAM-dependent methyltransferase [Pedobacter sp. MC2016-24]